MTRVLGLAVCVLLLAGCGEEAALSSRASSQLSADVARLRSAATAGTSSQVARAADALRSDVAAQRAAGDLSAERATAILDQLARVLADAATRQVATPTPTPDASTGGHRRKHRGKGEHDD